MALKLEDIPVTNVGKYLMGKMKLFGDRCAMVDGSTEKTYTYSEVMRRTELAAAGLQSIGVSKGDVVAIISPNCPDYMVAFYASALVTAVFQPINPMLPTDDLNGVLTRCSTKFIITIPALLQKVQDAMSGIDIKVIVFGQAEGFVSFDSLLDPSHKANVTPDCDPKTTTVALLSSSGTTGKPKALLVSHFNMLANIEQMLAADFILDGETFILFMPMFHIYGLIALCAVSHSGGSNFVVMERFSPEGYLSNIQKYKPSILQVVPPVMVMFAKHPKVSEYDLSSVKAIVCGAAPLSQEIEDAVKAKLNVEIYQGYGMSEIGITHANSRKSNRAKSVGKKLQLVETKILDVDTGKVLGPNEEGELWARGPQVCNGYLNLPQQTTETFLDDGWVKTGDIAKEDEDGFLYIVDRVKELIKYKAYQVAPATLEDVLLSHDAVADVGVVGVPDEEAGELPRAYVLKKAGADISKEDLIQFVAEKVAPHMKLRGGLEFVTEIPRTLAGKILRKSLREKATASAT